MRMNDPRVVAEVRAVFDRYETALVTNDIDTLIELFLDSPHTVRYGIDDVQHGHAEVATFRRDEPQASPPRRLFGTVISTFGNDVAIANTQFVPQATNAVGRQSQTWIRSDAGWRVVSAHVSWEGGRAP